MDLTLFPSELAVDTPCYSSYPSVRAPLCLLHFFVNFSATSLSASRAKNAKRPKIAFLCRKIASLVSRSQKIALLSVLRQRFSSRSSLSLSPRFSAFLADLLTWPSLLWTLLYMYVRHRHHHEIEPLQLAAAGRSASRKTKSRRADGSFGCWAATTTTTTTVVGCCGTS